MAVRGFAGNIGALRRERAVAAFNLIVVISFASYVVAHDRISPLRFAALVADYLPLTLALAATALLCFAAIEVGRVGIASRGMASPARAVAAAIQRRWREDRLFSLAWPLLLFALLLPSFTAFKQRVLPQAGFRFDAQLAAIDRALFGVDPGLWLHQAIGSPALTYFFDAVYHAWFLPMALGVGIVAICEDARTRAQYMTSFVGIWIGLGAALAYLLPAAGPCFYAALVDPVGAGPFLAVRHALLTDEAANAALLLSSMEIQDMLLRGFDGREMTIGGGISALPSVHNALAVLFALASFRINRGAGLMMSGFALLIWAASVYLNWHYAIDGIAGGLGAVILWYGSGWVLDGLSPRPASRGYPNCISTSPAASAAAATIRRRPNFSPRNRLPIAAANTTEVSRSADTFAVSISEKA